MSVKIFCDRCGDELTNFTRHSMVISTTIPVTETTIPAPAPPPPGEILVRHDHDQHEIDDICKSCMNEILDYATTPHYRGTPR